MKTSIITIVVMMILFSTLVAQTPQAFKYQTIIRNNAGEVLNNRQVSFQIGIIRDSILYAPSYYETHVVTTNEFGLASLNIGLGTPTYGLFDTINWGNANYHLEIGLDTTGGSSYILMGTTQLLAVPYALYSENTINKDDEDWTRSEDYIYTISDSVGIGISTPGAKLDVAGNITQSNTGGSVFLGEGAGHMDDLSVKNNVAIGSHALYYNTDKGGLVAIGDSTLFNNSIGSIYEEWATKNTAVGSNAMFSNTTGSSNTAIGRKAMYANTTGTKNTALGVSSLLNNTTGHSNTAVGTSSMYSNIYGTNNTAVGFTSLISNETGSGNTAVGKGALFYNINGGDNIAIGTAAMYSNTSGSSNTACGILALDSNDSGIFNCAYGKSSLSKNQDGNNNTALGFQALWGNESGNSNIAIGIRALYNSSDPSNLVAIGDSALYNNGYGATLPDHGKANTAIGSKTLYSNTLGYRNTALGYNSLYANITGFNNIALGYQTMYHNDNGNNNVAVGDKAMLSNIIGSNNVAIGSEASYSFIDGNYNTAIGYNAGWENFSGDGNIFLGSYAGYYEAGSNKLYIENSDSDKNNSLIYGEFDNNILAFNASVGIGTTNPLDELHVIGSIRMVDGNQAIGRLLVSDANGTGSWINPAEISDGDWTVDGNNIYSSVLANVGIGTSSPGVRLEVLGDYIGLKPNIRAVGDIHLGNGVLSGGGLYFGSGGYSWATGDYIRQTAVGIIEIIAGGTNYGTQLVVNNGSVGIGTSLPYAKLHVNGAIRLGTGVRNYEVLEVDPSYPVGWSPLINYGGIGIGSNDGNNRQMFMFTDGSTTDNIFTVATSQNNGSTWEADMVIRQDGNIGINTSSPARKLHINDVMRLEPRSSAPGSPSAGDLYFDSTTSKLRCYDGSAWQDCW